MDWYISCLFGSVKIDSFLRAAVTYGAALALCTGTLSAQETTATAIDSGHSAWLLTATALVLFMTMPGLALFYGGLVRGKNFLSILGQCAGIAFLASLLWVAGLYSLAFKGDGKWIGDFSAVFLKGVSLESVAAGTKIPETMFVMFQMTFAIITPGLFVGAVAERMKFGAVLMFSSLWLLLVYTPVTKWVWGGGWLYQMGVKDLAGGIVVHATAGVTALVLAIMVGKRRGFPQHPHPPHNPAMVFVGAAMLWVGWFGFNAGSQLTAGSAAGMTMLVTHLSACAAALVWMVLEKIRNGKVGIIGMVTGLVAGLASITPASGDVGSAGAVAIGAIAAVICYFSVSLIREKWHIDDSLDVFAVHGVGGIFGTIVLSFLGQTSMGGLGHVKSIGEQLPIQLIALTATILWTTVASVLIVLLVKFTIGLRVSAEQENEGLDRAEHGESADSGES